MSQNTNGIYDTDTGDRVPILKPDTKLLRRLETLNIHFKSKYDVAPEFFVRVPGRVNLIGEHIDYCGYSVCPMALEQDILLAIATSKNEEIRLTNVDGKYKDFRCDLQNVSACINDAEDGPAWHKYFLCGVKGALEAIPEEYSLPGIFVAVWGNIPPNAGLSSSSALVSAAVLSSVKASQYQLTKHELATISASAERHIGTQGGGMDQAIAFLAKEGSAKLIEFNPLRATDVTLPENAVFVIAHSQAYHNKASTADYNLRVSECRLAAQIIAKKRNKDWENVRRLIDVQEKLEATLEEMAEYVKMDLHEKPYTFDEICEKLDTTHERLKRISLVASFSASQTFKLKQRALHVFQEASRVAAFRRVSETRDMPEDERLRELGNLMSQSHESLRELYECSHPAVDALVTAAIDCGALGARLTGAGWGGCIVAIITKDKVQQFVNDLRAKLCENSTEEGVNLKDLVFPTEPKQGAAIYVI